MNSDLRQPVTVSEAPISEGEKSARGGDTISLRASKTGGLRVQLPIALVSVLIASVAGVVTTKVSAPEPTTAAPAAVPSFSVSSTDPLRREVAEVSERAERTEKSLERMAKELEGVRDDVRLLLRRELRRVPAPAPQIDPEAQ